MSRCAGVVTLVDSNTRGHCAFVATVGVPAESQIGLWLEGGWEAPVIRARPASRLTPRSRAHEACQGLHTAVVGRCPSTHPLPKSIGAKMR